MIPSFVVTAQYKTAGVGANNLIVTDLVETVVLDNGVLSQLHRLIGADLVEVVALDNGTVVLTIFLTSQDLVEAVVLDNSTLSQNHRVTVADLVEAVVLDNATLSQLQLLTAQDLVEAVVLDNDTLTQLHQLLIVDLIALVVLDNVTIATIVAALDLLVQDLVEAVVLDNVTLSQAHVITVADLVQSVVLDNTTLAQLHNLTTNSLIIIQGIGFDRSLATVRFDGVNDWLVKTGGFATATERQGTFACWLALGSLHVGERRRLLTNGNFICEIDANNRIYLYVQNAAGTQYFAFGTASSTPGQNIYPGSGLVHIAMSWDVNFAAGSKKGKCILNGKSQVFSYFDDTFPAFDIVYNATTNFGSRQGDFIYKLDASVAEIWFNNSFFDFDLDSEKAKFFNLMTWEPADLGSAGQNPTGSSPLLYMKGPAASLPTNLGTGGNMTLTGSLEDDTSWLLAPELLAMVHALTTQDLTQLVVLDNSTLSQAHLITIQDLVEAVVLDNSTLSQAHIITVVDLVQAVVLDNDIITQNHFLVPTRLIVNWDTGFERSLATVRFDGVNDYLVKAGGFTGLVDSRQGSFSCWIDTKSLKSAPNFQFLFGNGETWNFYIAHDEFWRNISVHCQNAAGTMHFDFSSNTKRIEAQGGLMHLAASWDVDFGIGAKLASCAINGRAVASLYLDDVSPAFDIDYTGQFGFAGEGYVTTYLTDVAANHLWFDDSYIDFNLDSNIGKFIDQATLLPVDLGVDGSTPTGSAPILYCKGPAANIATNLGTGGNWSVVGSLTDETSYLLAPDPITQSHLITTADLVQAVVLDNGALSQGHMLVSNDLIQLVVLDSVDVRQIHTLTIADLFQDVVLDGSEFAPGVVVHTLTAQDLVQAVVLDTTTLAQVHLLTAGDLVQVVVLDGTALAMVHSLSAQDLAQAVVLDPTGLSQIHNLTVVDLAQLVVIDTTSLEQLHRLAAQGLVQDVVLDTTVLAQLHGLIPDDLILPVLLDNTTLGQVHKITVQDLIAAVYLDALPGELIPGGFGISSPGQQRLFVSGDRTIIIVRGTDTFIVAPQRDNLVAKDTGTTIVVTNEPMEV